MARRAHGEEPEMRYAEWAEEPERDTMPGTWLGAPKIVIADDDGAMRELVRAALVQAGYDVVEVATGADAVRVIDLIEPASLLVIDERMDGVRIVHALRARGTPVIFTTDRPDAYIRAEVEGAGAILLPKPFRLDTLRTLVLTALAAEANRLQGERTK
jgi:DNA-binding response OmpR family regulator